MDAYRIEHRMLGGWEPVNDELFESYNEAIADLNDFLLDAVDSGLDIDPADWRVSQVSHQDGSSVTASPLAS